MPASQNHHLHPLGWESDPEEERYKISTLDYLSVCSYNNYALFCRLDDAAGTFVVDILKAGLERTPSQARHLCGTIEKDRNGGHSFTKRRDSTARFVVQWLNSDPEYPSIDEIEEAHFSATKLGDLNTWSVPPMTYSEKPEAHQTRAPPLQPTRRISCAAAWCLSCTTTTRTT
ncbi:hypothetical protein BDW71DRAFT_187748 [Aspergillus fruticulosus]